MKEEYDEFADPAAWIAADQWASQNNDSSKNYPLHILLREGFMAGFRHAGERAAFNNGEKDANQ